MKYKLIQINFNDALGKFIISEESIPYNRQVQETTPKAVGFYYFKNTESSEKAFQELKTCMLNSIDDQINKLMLRKNQLEELIYENN